MCTGTDLLITIRPLERRDREPLRQIVEETGVFTPQEVDVAMELIDIVVDDRQPHDYTIFTAEGEGGEVSGYFCVGPTALTVGTYDLYWIAVKPSHHGQGIGRTLLRFAEDLVASRGGRLLVVQTSSQPKYDATRTFYLNNDYAEAARLRDYYKRGDDLVIYTKYFSQHQE